MADVTTALTEGLGTVATTATGMIGDLFAIALPIIGAIVLITLGMRVFKRFTRG